MRKLALVFRTRVRFGVVARVSNSNEEGVIESALAIIPLLVLFLISLQLIAAVNFLNIDKALVQSSASQGALATNGQNEGEIVTFQTSNQSNQLRLFITHKRRRLPEFLSSFSHFASLHQRSTDVTGVAVVENSK